MVEPPTPGATTPVALLLEGCKYAGSFVAGVVASHIKARHENLSKLIERLEQVVSDLAEAAGRYWALPTDGDAECHALAAKVLICSSRISTEIRYLNHEYRTFRFGDWSKLTALRQAATGDSFQTAQRAQEVNRAANIGVAAQLLIHSIRIARHPRNLVRRRR
jgi:hypothetical protein